MAEFVPEDIILLLMGELAYKDCLSFAQTCGRLFRIYCQNYSYIMYKRWLGTNICQLRDPISLKITANAALEGNLLAIMHLHRCSKFHTSPPFTKVIMDAAAAEGNLDIVKWLHKNRSEGCSKNALLWSASSGHRHVVQWLVETKLCDVTACDGQLFNHVAARGHLGVVQYLYEKNIDQSSRNLAMNSAAAGGQLHVVQWLHAHLFEDCTTTTMDDAARNGHLDVVEWLHTNRSEGCTEKAMDFAATNGHLHVVSWLHKNRNEGCTTYAMDCAAANGFLEVVQWLHKNRKEGCTEMAMRLAADNNYQHVVEWLQSIAGVSTIGVCTFSGQPRFKFHGIGFNCSGNEYFF